MQCAGSIQKCLKSINSPQKHLAFAKPKKKGSFSAAFWDFLGVCFIQVYF